MRRKQRQFGFDALENRDLKSDSSGLPDVFINWDGDLSNVPNEIRTLPPGYTTIDNGSVILKPIDAGFQGTVDTFYWFYNQITKDWWSSPSKDAK